MSETPKTLDLELLKMPFSPASVSWRVGSTTGDKSKGMALAYIDARDVMERLDEVCGQDGWQVNYSWSDGKKMCCQIGIKVNVNGEWVWKANGAGETDFEGDKGAFSDAFKRAAVLWGIGRYLYDVKTPWMPIKQQGKSYVFTDESLSKLIQMLPGPMGQRRINIPLAKRQDFYRFVREALDRSDEIAMREAWEDVDQEHELVYWSLFNSQERAFIKELRKL